MSVKSRGVENPALQAEPLAGGRINIPFPHTNHGRVATVMRNNILSVDMDAIVSCLTDPITTYS